MFGPVINFLVKVVAPIAVTVVSAIVAQGNNFIANAVNTVAGWFGGGSGSSSHSSSGSSSNRGTSSVISFEEQRRLAVQQRQQRQSLERDISYSLEQSEPEEEPPLDFADLLLPALVPTEIMLAAWGNPVAESMVIMMRNEPDLLHAIMNAASSLEEGLLNHFAEAGRNEEWDKQAVNLFKQLNSQISDQNPSYDVVVTPEDQAADLRESIDRTQYVLARLNDIRTEYTDNQIYRLYLGLAERGYLPPDPRYIYGELPIPDYVRVAVLQAHDRYLNDLYVQTAIQTNIPALTNMSNEAMAAFMLSQTRQETDTWDRELNIIGSTSSHIADEFWANAAKLGAAIAVAIQYIPNQELQNRFGIFTEENNPDVPIRLRGRSLGVPNIYLRPYQEAIDFVQRLVNSQHVDVNNLSIPSSDNHAFDINYDPIFAMRGLGLILNWSAARQMIGEGAGNADLPAIEADNFGLNTRVEPISAFSIAFTRYSDEVFFANTLSNIGAYGEFYKYIRAVEETRQSAEALGFTLGGEGSDIVLGQDFLPYTSSEAIAIVNALREDIDNGSSTAKATFCAAVLLQQVYESSTNTSALGSIECD